jgi:hypothetical protein
MFPMITRTGQEDLIHLLLWVRLSPINKALEPHLPTTLTHSIKFHFRSFTITQNKLENAFICLDDLIILSTPENRNMEENFEETEFQEMT